MIIEHGKKYTLMLTVTEKCNLNCIYCYEGVKSEKIMPFEIAKKSIADTFNLLDESNTLIITFHGGEPLTAFDLIKKICDWVWSQKWNCKYIFFATTNATLLNDEMKNWFSLNKSRIILGLSYDGTDFMQDINRSGSSKFIDKKFFLETYPKQSVKMTISKKTVGNISEGIIFLQKQGFTVNANLAYGTDWDMTDSLEIFAEQLNKLADFYIENPKIIPSSILNIKLESIFDKNNISKRSCGSGRRMCSVSQEGKIYPCHMFMPSSFGENKNISEIQNKLENGILLEKKCIDCYMSAICPTCYGMNLIICGDLSKRREDYCKMMKIRALAATYMFGTMLSSKNFSEYAVFDNFSENKINAYKKAIFILQEKLSYEKFL